MMKKITLRAILLVAVVLCGMTNSLKAATITVSSNAVVAGSNYNSIKSAYAYIVGLGTLSEPYVIQLGSTYNPSIAEETYPITFGANGASATNDITIKPATGAKITIGNANTTSIFTNVSTLTTSADLAVTESTSNVTAGMTVYGYGPFISSAGHPTVSSATATTITCSRNMSTAGTGATIYVGTPNTKTLLFNGAKYITIDGVSRTDASTGLTIQNPNSIQASTIWIDGGSSYNTIKNCFVKGANVSGMAYNNGGCGQIMFYNGENDFNTITNNDICDIDGLPMPICMVLLTYGSSSTNNDNTISDNKIYNIGNGTSPNGNTQVVGFSSTGTTTAYNNNILNNRIYWTKTAVFRTNPYIFGMGSTYNGLGNKFEGNVIGWQADGITRAEITAPLNTALTFYGSNVKNCTFKNNVIGGINFASKAFVGFQLFAHNTSTPNADDVCYGNQVKDITVNSSVTGANFYGIMVTASSPFTYNIKNNKVMNIIVSSPTAANTCTLQGILNNFGAPSPLYNVNCIGNEVSNLTAGNAGSSASNVIIAFVNGGAVSQVEKNIIYNLNTISTGTGSVIKGLRFALSNTNGANIQNNIIRLGTDVTSDVEIHAIYHEATSNDAHTFNFYHNTIYIGGTSTTKNAHIFTHTGLLKSVVSLKNNIFSNVRTGGTAINQVYNIAKLSDIANTANNLYQYGTKFASKSAAPFTFTALADWNSMRTDSTLTLDASSKDQLDPLFTAATGTSAPDMHLSSSSPANESGLAIATVTDDFASAIRSLYTTASTTNADMGAFAISNATALEATKQLPGLSVFAIENNIMFNNLSGNTAKMYSLSGQLVKSIALTSDKVAVPTAKGLYIVKVDEKVIKVLVK